MGDISQLLVTFVNPIILIMALVLALSIARRYRKDALNIDVLMGGVLSLAALHTMADPIALPNGGQYDMRGLIIGIAAALFGPKTGAIVLATAITYRIGIGNPGLTPGLTHIGIAYAVGVAWWYYARNLDWPELAKSATLGCLLSLSLLAIFLGPSAIWMQLFVALTPYTIVCNVVGVIMIRYLIETELSFLDTTAGLEKAAQTDHLTGLLNRRSLEEKFDRFAGGDRVSKGLTTLYFDIDKFKQINDSFGHAAGDAVLQVVSSRLASTFRVQDIFSRIGGDEFVVVLPNLSEAEAEAVAERCRKTIAEAPILVGGREVYVTISVGAVWTDEVDSFQQLLGLADQALYMAKSNGRNAVEFYNSPIRDPLETPRATA